MSATGDALVYSTYLGGDGSDFGNAIALDTAGNASVVGLTTSTDFPTTADTIQSSNAGSNDGFVTRLNAAGTGLAFSANGDSFQFDSTTGEYKFTQASAGGLTLTGTGVLSQQGCLLLLEDNQSGRRVVAHFNQCNNKGQAVIQIESERKSTFVITDKDTTNNNCAP